MAAKLVAPAPGGGASSPPSAPDGRHYSLVLGEGSQAVGDPAGSLLLRSGQAWVSSDFTRGRPLQASTGAATVRWRRAGLLISAAPGSSVVIVATGRATLIAGGKRTVLRGGNAVRILADGSVDQKEPVRREELLADPWLASASGLPPEGRPPHRRLPYLAGAVFFALAAVAVAVGPAALDHGGRGTNAGQPTAQSTPQTAAPTTRRAGAPPVSTPSVTLAPSLAAPPPTVHTTLPGGSGSSGTTAGRDQTPPRSTPSTTNTSTTMTTPSTAPPVQAAAPVTASTPNGASITMATCSPTGSLVMATGTATGPAGTAATITVSFVTADGTQLPATVRSIQFTGASVPWQASAPLPANSGGGRCWATIKS